MKDRGPWICLCMVSLAMLTAGAGCSPAAAPASVAADGVADVAAEADVAASPARIVSLHDTTTELVVLLGRADRLVAITEPRFLSDAALAAVAEVPRLPGGPLSVEAVAALRPDLVLGTDVVEEQQPALPAGLEALGISTWWMDPAGLDGLFRMTRELGQRLDASQQATAWVADARATLPAPVEGPPVDVFIYDCCDPPFTAGGRSPATELLARMGARNIFAEVDQDWMTVSWEAVAAASPALIIVHDYPWQGQADIDGKLSTLRHHPLLAHTPAVQHDALVAVPLALTLEGPRVLELPALLAPVIDRARP